MTTSKSARALTWILAAAPALACLAWVLAWAAAVPEPAAWRALWFEPELRLSWDNFWNFDGEPNLFGFRAAYLALVFAPGSDFGRFGIVAWLLVALSLLFIVLLLRRMRHDRAPDTVAVPPVVLVVLALWLFSPAYGADWILGARFRVFAPSACMLAGVWVLVGEGAWRLRWSAAFVAASVAIATDRSGWLVWVALVPLIYTEARRRQQRPLASLGVWCVLFNIATLVILDERIGETTGWVRRLVDAPLDTLGSVARVAGWAAPDLLPATVLDDQAVGVGLALLALAAVVWRSPSTPRMSTPRIMPWVSLCVFGLLSAVWIVDAFLPARFADSYLREAARGPLLLAVGVIGMWSSVSLRSAQRCGLVLLVLVIPTAQDWFRGIEHLRIGRALLRQEQGRLVFSNFAEQLMPAHRFVVRPTLVRQLRARGRLSESVPLDSLDITELADLTTAGEGVVESALRTSVQGSVAGADLVLVTRRGVDGAEGVCAVAIPSLAVGTERLRWAAEFGEASFADGDIIRAWGFEAPARRARLLAGAYRFTNGSFVQVPR